MPDGISKPATASPSMAPVKTGPKGPDQAHSPQDLTTYSTYDKERGHPWVAERYGVERFWNEDIGGYQPEIEAIKRHLESRISQGMEDTTEAANAELKQLEKLAGVAKTDRVAVKLPQLKALIEFLDRKLEIRKDAVRYGQP